MKFSAKTYMQTGTFRDMSLARLQNAMVDSPLSGFYHHAEYQNLGWTNVWTYAMFLLSLTCCAWACVFAFRARKEGDYDLEGGLRQMLLQQRSPTNTMGKEDETLERQEEEVKAVPTARKSSRLRMLMTTLLEKKSKLRLENKGSK
jgi:hypothetical protein